MTTQNTNKFYFDSTCIEILKKEFQEFMLKKSVDINSDTSGYRVRDLMFDFFKTKIFLDLFFKIAAEGAKSVDLLNDGLLLQSFPTPRVFRPGDHGTSFHTDYWYGHGESAYTIWIPLTKIDENNTFRICNEIDNSKFLKDFETTPAVIEAEKDLIEKSFPAMPGVNQAVIFGSKMLHGSPLNSSSKERISFDFRISKKDDQTSTKDILGYYEYLSGSFRKQPDRFGKKRFLKYICGGHGKNTNAQHLMIEAAANFYKINIVAQEAEIERFGFPMLMSYIDNLAISKNLDGLILASRNIINFDKVKDHGKGNLIIYFCLENEFVII
jgi:hypothetical protein